MMTMEGSTLMNVTTCSHAILSKLQDEGIIMGRYTRIGEPGPRIGQPCINRDGDTLCDVTDRWWDYQIGVMIGVTPRGGFHQTSMRLADWERLYRLPDAPKAARQ